MAVVHILSALCLLQGLLLPLAAASLSILEAQGFSRPLLFLASSAVEEFLEGTFS